MATGKKFGGDTRLTLQSDSEIDEEQDGSLRGHAEFEGDISLLNTKPHKGDPHPKNQSCTAYFIKTRYLANKKVRVMADYIGLSQDPTPYFIEFVGSVGEEAIETHPHFIDVIGGTSAAPLHGAVFDDDGQFLGFPVDAPSHLGGVRSYFRPSVIVRASYWQSGLPNAGPLGHIESASYIPGLSLPSNSNNLLVTNFSHRSMTPGYGPFQVSVELLASGPSGWNDKIYSGSGSDF